MKAHGNVGCAIVPALLFLLLLIGCSSSGVLSVTDIEVETLRDAGYARLGGRTWRSETMFETSIHTCQALYDIDLVCTGSTSIGRRYAVIIWRWEGGKLVKIYSTHGSIGGVCTLYEAVNIVHHEIERYEKGDQKNWQGRVWTSPQGVTFPPDTLAPKPIGYYNRVTK